MFTGIIEELGEVRAVDHAQDAATLTVSGPQVTSDASHGDSIAVDGVCLTVTAHGSGWFSADVMAETLHRSTLGSLVPGSRVNLERAMPSSGRFGGHIVQGHIDGVVEVESITPAEKWTVVRLRAPHRLSRYLAEKGSVALNGVSLTISAISTEPAQDWFEISLIPTTLVATNLGGLAVDDQLNVEVDVIAKYLERLGSVEVAR